MSENISALSIELLRVKATAAESCYLPDKIADAGSQDFRLACVLRGFGFLPRIWIL